jgi:hypothetical protein
MAARITKRGRYWQIHGTIRVGKANRRLGETTGTDEKKTSRLILSQRVTEAERELLGRRRSHRPAP